MDGAEIAKPKYISVLVGSLDAPNQTFLVDCHPLESGSNVNSSIILHTVDDILRQLEIKRENFLLFLTGAARYMSLAGKILTLCRPRSFDHFGFYRTKLISLFFSMYFGVSVGDLERKMLYVA